MRCTVSIFVCFFVKQKTAYEVRISDWSSDVCSSDLQEDQVRPAPRLRPCLQPRDRRFGDDIERGALPDMARAAVDRVEHMRAAVARLVALGAEHEALQDDARLALEQLGQFDEIGRASCRERVVSVRVGLGGRRIIKKKKK